MPSADLCRCETIDQIGDQPLSAAEGALPVDLGDLDDLPSVRAAGEKLRPREVGAAPTRFDGGGGGADGFCIRAEELVEEGPGLQEPLAVGQGVPREELIA